MEFSQKAFVGYGLFMIVLGIGDAILQASPRLLGITISAMGFIIMMRELTPRKGER